MRFFDSYCGIYKIISVTAKRSVKTQISEKKTIIPVKKLVGQTFLIFSSMADLKEDFWRFQKIFWRFLYKI